MEFSLTFENLDQRIRTNKYFLDGVRANIRAIFPREHVSLRVFYSFTNTYEVDQVSGAMIPVGPVKIILKNVTNSVQKSLLNPQYDHIVKIIAEQLHYFLAEIDPNNDPSVQPEYFPHSEISINAGFGVTLFTDGRSYEYL